MNQNKVDRSISIIQLASKMSDKYYGPPLIITYSGGKDSDVLMHLAMSAGCSIEFQNNHTTVDAPETVRHIRSVFTEREREGYKCTINYPHDKDGNPISMWTLIPQKRMPPTRIVRYCCSVLKETGGSNRMIATGIRAEESASRKKRSEFEIIVRSKSERKGVPFEKMESEFVSSNEDDIYNCLIIQNAKKHNKTVVNPIYNWTDKDVWNYIHENKIPYNPLYDRGWKRVGCIGCPYGTTKGQAREFVEYPAYKKLYIMAFQKMVDKRIQDGLPTKWKTGEDVYNWWLDLPEAHGQLSLFDLDDKNNDKH